LGRVASKGSIALLLLLMVAVLAGCGAPVVDAGWAAFSAGPSALYAGLADGKLTALDPKGAQVVWQFPESERLGGFYGPPVLAGEQVIFAASDVAGRTSKAYSVNVKTGQGGQVLVDSQERIIGAPTVYGDTVYVASADHNVYVRDLQSGATRVLFTADGPIWGSVVRDGDRLYLASMDHSVYALDLEGRELWRFQAAAAIPGTPAVVDGRVYVGDLSGAVYALDADTGTEAWPAPFKAENWVWGQPVVVGDTLYAPSLDGTVYALDVQTGAPKPEWHIRAEGAVCAGPTLAGDTLYVASESGHLYAVDVNTHQPKWAPYKTDGQLLTPPVVVDNTVYVTTSNGKVYQVDAATGNGRQIYPQPK
jgi:outer membrane protein assembly factor BamB